MNCLFTVNIGHVLHPYARKTMIDASRRWGCHYLEIAQGAPGITLAVSSKYYGFKSLNGYSQACYIDADCLISKDCPSPFGLCNPIGNQICVVHDSNSDTWFSGAYTAPIKSLESKLEHIDGQVVLADIANLKWTGTPDDFFNSGFMVSSPESDAFQLMITAFEHNLVETFAEEQALFNMLCHTGKWLTKRFLDPKWNWLFYSRGQNKEAYVRHYAGGLWPDRLKEIDFAEAASKAQ